MSYVLLGDVCRQQLGMQAQYGTRYADPDWSHEYIYCGTGLRIILNENKDYHRYKIHEDDVVLFVAMVKIAKSLERK